MACILWLSMALPALAQAVAKPKAITAADLENAAVHVEKLLGGGGDAKDRWWFVDITTESGKAIRVRIHAPEKPKLQYCMWIQLANVSGDLATGFHVRKFTVLPPRDPKGKQDGGKQPPVAPPKGGKEDPTESPPKRDVPPKEETPPPQPPVAPEPPKETPPKAPEPPVQPPTQPQPPPERQPDPGWGVPPPEIPEWLVPWWEAVKYAVPGSEIAAAMPGGKDVLGALLARLNVKIKEELRKDAEGKPNNLEWYESLKKSVQRAYDR